MATKHSPENSRPSAGGIRAVALRARVSPATVSRVVNGQTTVDAKLAKRVRDAIRETGYLPNPQARALGSGRSRVLGLIISELTNPFYPELVQSFENLAETNDFEIMLGSVIHRNAEQVKLFIRRLVQRRVEGVAVMTFRADSDYLHELISHHIPLVMIDGAAAGARCVVLKVDYRCGINQAIQHLALLGHRRIGFISGPLQYFTNQARRDAFLESVRSAGLHPDDTPIFEGDHTFEAGVTAVRHFLALRVRPTAILSSNDLMAVGVLRALGENKVQVPDEMSVVGFDGIRLAEFVHPPLSTVRMPHEDLAAAAFDGLMRLIQGSDPIQSGSIRVNTQLVIRQSTGPYRNAATSAPPISDAAAAILRNKVTGGLPPERIEKSAQTQEQNAEQDERS